MTQDPQPEFRPQPGRAERLEPALRRVLAPNPSPMTFRGTNTYLLGQEDLAIIDPGPNDPAHLEALLAATGTSRVSAILVTHAHCDHAPLAAVLAARVGAPVYAFSDAYGGRSAVMQRLAAQGRLDGGEGVDTGFTPDITLGDGDSLSGAGWHLRALHTPGHFGNHLCFAWGDRLFSGDLVMGWATSLVSPPDGDLTDFMASCARLAAARWSVFYPGHGAPILNTSERLAWLIHHRRSREAAILAALNAGPATSAQLAQRIYTDTKAELLPAATRNVLAHLIDLYGKYRVHPIDPLSANARFARTEPDH